MATAREARYSLDNPPENAKISSVTFGSGPDGFRQPVRKYPDKWRTLNMCQ